MDCGVYQIMPFIGSLFFFNGTLPIELPYWELNPLHCFLVFLGPISGVLTEGELTFTHIYGMVLTDEIFGKSTSESNHTLKYASSRSSSDIVLLKLN